MKVHSIVSLITNSSTVIYTSATRETVEKAKKLIELLVGNSDNFEVSLIPSDEYIEQITEEDEEIYEKVSHIGWQDSINEIRKLIASGEIKIPSQSEDDWDAIHEGRTWSLMVTKNGNEITEFDDFFNSFNQEAVYNG